jgi:hypothetical protein
MIGLRDEVGGDPRRMRTVVGDDEDLARTRHFVDIHYTVDHALGGLHVGVTGPDNFVDRRDTRSSIGKRGDRVRTADAIKFVDAGNRRGGHDLGPRTIGRGRRDHHDFAYPGDARRNRIHQHRGRIRAHPARDIDADAVKRAHHLTEAHPETVSVREGFLDGLLMKCGDAARGQFERTPIGFGKLAQRVAKFLRGNAQRFGCELHAVEAQRVVDERGVAALADIGNNVSHRGIEARGVIAAAPRDDGLKEPLEFRRP